VNLLKSLEPVPTHAELEEITDEELMEILGDQFTPRKRKITKAKQVHDRHLRCSKRSASKLGGFKKDVLHPVPFAMITGPPRTPALATTPFLLLEVAQGIATGFLQIYPSDVSASILKKDANGK